MKPYLIFTLCLLLSVFCLLPIAGCDEEQLQRVDRIAEQAKDVTVVGEKILDSPVGGYVPVDWNFWLRAGGAAFAGLVLAWEEWRNRKKQVALEEIVNGGEILKDTASEETVKQFKEAQSTAQSVATTKVVAEIQKTL